MSVIKSYQGESATDLSVRGLRNVEGLVDFCLANGVAVDSEEAVATERTVDDSLKVELAKIKPVFQPKVIPTIPPSIVNSDQNIIDLALQETGSVEGLVDLLVLNQLGPDDNAPAGTVLNTKGLAVRSESVHSFYRQNNHKVNTGVVDTPEPVIETVNVNAELIDRFEGTDTQWNVAFDNGEDDPEQMSFEGSGDQSGELLINEGTIVCTINKISEFGAIAGKVLIKTFVNGFPYFSQSFITSGEVIGPFVLEFTVNPGDTIDVVIVENVNELNYDYTSDFVNDWSVEYTCTPSSEGIEFEFSGSGGITGRILSVPDVGSDAQARVRKIGNGGVAQANVIVSWRKNGGEIHYEVIPVGELVDVTYTFEGLIAEDTLTAEIVETV